MKLKNHRLFEAQKSDLPGGSSDGEPLSPLLKTLWGLDDEANEADTKDRQEGEQSPAAGATLHQALAEPAAENKANEVEANKKKAEEAEAAKAGEAAKVAAGAHANEGEAEQIKVKKKTAKAAKSQAEIVAEQEQARAALEAEKAAKAKGEWEGTLLDEERDQLELARAAERLHPEKHKGLAAKTEKFLRDHAAKVEQPDFDPESDDYQEWLKKERPVLSQSEIRSIERSRGAEIARQEAAKLSNEVLDKTFRAIEVPVLKRAVDEYYTKASKEVMPEDMAKAFAEDPAKAREQFPLEYEIVETVMDAHASDVEELLMLTRVNPDTRRTLKTFDESNPQHRRVIEMVTAVDDQFKRTAGKDAIRDGKRFMTRAELAQVPPAKRGNYWTFSSSELAARSTALAKDKVAKSLAAETARLKRYGFERKAQQAAAPAAPATPEKKTPPAARPSQIPPTSGKPAESNTDRLLREAGMLGPV